MEWLADPKLYEMARGKIVRLAVCGVCGNYEIMTGDKLPGWSNPGHGLDLHCPNCTMKLTWSGKADSVARYCVVKSEALGNLDYIAIDRSSSDKSYESWDLYCQGAFSGDFDSFEALEEEVRANVRTKLGLAAFISVKKPPVTNFDIMKAMGAE